MNSRFIGIVFLIVALAACTQAGQPTDASPETGRVRLSYESLVSTLRQKGLRVEPLGPIDQSFFTPAARVIRIGETGEAQVYEYANVQAAESDARRVNADGSIGSSMPMWIAPPHFFRKENLLVLYLGTDEKTLSALREMLGAQFAGQ